MSDLHTASHETLEAIAAFHLRRLSELNQQGTWALLGSIVSAAAGGYELARGELFSDEHAVIVLLCFAMPLWLAVNRLHVRWARTLMRQIVGALGRRGAVVVEGGIFGPGYRIVEHSKGDARVAADIQRLLR